MSDNRSAPLKIGLLSLVLLIIVTIDSVRNLPSTALFGPALIFLYLISACFLLIPGAIASSELTYSWPGKGGIYQWVSMGLGKKTGFFAVWGQWINTLIWFPTILSFVASSLAYVFFPQWMEHPYFLSIATLLCFWGLTVLSLFGFKVSARVAVFCSIAGLIIPMGFIVTLAIIWMWEAHPLQIVFNRFSVFPKFSSLDDWFSLVAIMTSFLGFELVAVHVADIANPKKDYAKAITIAVVLLLFTMVMGSLAIAIIVPRSEIVFVHGVAQAFRAFLDAYHLSPLLPVLIVLMALGSLGEMINWLAAPAKGMYQASLDGFLPARWHHKNRFGAEYNLLLIQAAIVSVMCVTFILIPSVNSTYWFLTNLSVEIYMLVYLLMFVAAMVIEFKHPERARLYAFSKRRVIIIGIYLLGVIGCSVTLVVGAFPPPDIIVSSQSNYQLMFWLGIVIAFLPNLLLHWQHRNKMREKDLSSVKI